MQSQCQWLFEAAADCIRRICKHAAHYFTGQSEIMRICSRKSYDANAAKAFAVSFKKSKRLSTFSKIVFQLDHPKPFSVAQMKQRICERKISPSEPLLATTIDRNLTFCLEEINLVNAILDRMVRYTQQQFNAAKPEHVGDLDELWKLLKPDVRRVGDSDNGIESSQWGEIGFQGRNPSTDFRGMGYLGLIQLLYFAQKRTERAKAILLESNHPRRYFPFAATGINFTAFVIELCKNGRIYSVLLKLMVRIRCQNPASPNEESISFGICMIHDLYCDCFEQFATLWVQRNPANIMAFPMIFADVKESFLRKYQQFV